MRQFLFCVEANKRSNSDYIYITEIIKEFYSYDDSKYSFKCIHMGSKTRYNSNKVNKQINKWIKPFSGKTTVFICVDTDDARNNYDDQKVLDEIKRYCQEKEYELIWFCRDIEEVCIEKRISSEDKVNEAEMFRRRKTVRTIKESNLTHKEYSNYKSNILNVLDKYLKRYKVRGGERL